MKQLLTVAFTLLILNSYGQEKYSHTHFNKLTEVEGTDYVIATVENRDKAQGINNHFLLFIDAGTGKTNQVDFPKDGNIEKVEQVKMDDLGINKIIVSAQTIDLDGKKGIGWNELKQIIILSTDGKERIQLTDNKLFVKSWVVNHKTGTIVITGYYDTNNNGKYDKTDKSEISIYDLKTLRLLGKV
ncbi:Uncharacterised protein [Sphingobacterium spiritivorum]|uniref:Uncharacterized protein n=1 Tax=Sphingobacterium spiritivorum TaxID=258 RepID=A0A380CPE0_SPHSI|nr:hypothetical protein [Sphingobacterium spiritivorum]SUJ25749.1 Uncharacterised protein [Sphingobacterium spiritivorum]